MKKEMRLQGIGLVEGTEAGNIQVGDILRWNYGGLEKVVSIEFTKTGKTIICGIEYINYHGEVIQTERKMRVDRLVNIVASGNAKLTGEASFEIIEEAAEEVKESIAIIELKKLVEERKAKKAAEEVKEVEAAEEVETYPTPEEVAADVDTWEKIKPAEYLVYYRFTDYGGHVEVMLFVEDKANEITIVAQKEAEFENMQQARYLYETIKRTGTKIEIVEPAAYTG